MLEVDRKQRQPTRQNHSATHLMHKALREVLGAHVQQKGSLVDPDKTRFDFAHNAPLTDDELRRVEALVNAEILDNQPTNARVMAIDEAQKECVRRNSLESCYIRPIAFYGSVAMGVAAKSNPVHLAVAAWPWGAYLGTEGIEKGIRVRTSSYTHHHPNITMCGAKAVSNYSVSILANQEATHDGYEEAMLLDPQGYMYALNAATGQVLWSFASGGSCNAGAAVSNGVVYWGSGYSAFGTPNNKVYAFGLP